MSALDALLRAIFDVLLMPFSGLPPLVGLLILSLVTAVVMLLVFKKASNQEAIDNVKRKITAGLFEIRLFSDDVVAILKAQGGILRNNVTYLRLSFTPMLWMIIPLTLVVAQLQFHYGYRGLRPGEKTLLKVQLDSASLPPETLGGQGKPSVALKLPEGLKADSPSLWIPSTREMVWRIQAVRDGRYEIGVGVAGQTYTKSADVGGGVRRRSPVRYAPGFLSLLLYPAEAPLPRNGPLDSITLEYPEVDVPIGVNLPIIGNQINWLILFPVLAISFAFLLRKPFGVKI